METLPLVSVIIPCFNSAQYIEVAILSAINQSYSNVEIIVIDDGSTDTSVDIIRKQLSKGNITLLTHPNNQNHGVSSTRKKGIDSANGKYIAFLDADDYFEPNKLETQIALLEKHSHCVLSHTAVNVLYDDVTETCFDSWFNYSDELHEYNLCATEGYLKYNKICNSSVVIRQELAKQLPFHSKQLFQFEDMLTWTLAAQHGPFLYTPQRLTGYRYHCNSATKKVLSDALRSSYSYLEFYLTLLGKPISEETRNICFGQIYNILDNLYAQYATQTHNTVSELPFVHAAKAQATVIEEQKAHIEQLLKQNAELQLQIDTMALQVTEAASQLAAQATEAASQLAALDAKIKYQEHSLAEMKNHLAYTDKQLYDIWNSWSWKITAPMRKLISLANSKTQKG